MVHVIRRVYLAEFDDLGVGERGGVFDQLDEFAGSEAEGRRVRGAGGIGGADHVQVEAKKGIKRCAVADEILPYLFLQLDISFGTGTEKFETDTVNVIVSKVFIIDR